MMRIVKAMVYIIKAIIVLFLISILFALGSALYYLVHDKGGSTRMVKALTWRISLSLFLLVLIMIAYALGWITPHSI
jgi:hypothetical protein